MNRVLLVKQFDKKLNEIIREELPLLKEIKKFVIKSGGKRIRPITHFYFSKILGYEGDEWKDVGAIGELIHAASLLHDDVVDKSDRRRGKPTINAVYDNKTAVLSGDYLLACGLDHLNTLKHRDKLLSLFTRVIRMLSVGELLQMEWESNYKIAEKTYEQIIKGKTAVLFGAMTESAAILAELDASRQEEYRLFGEKLGRIFQIRDDYLDYYGDSEKEGKENFQDFKRGLITRPVIVLRSALNGKRGKVLEKAWKSEEMRASQEGEALWSELAEEVDLNGLLVGEIQQEITSLVSVLKQHPESDYVGKVAENLEQLMV